MRKFCYTVTFTSLLNFFFQSNSIRNAIASARRVKLTDRILQLTEMQLPLTDMVREFEPHPLQKAIPGL